MQKLQETVLYYHTDNGKRVRLLKSVMVRMDVKIKNVEPEQVMEQVGYLAGMPGYEPASAGQEETLLPADGQEKPSLPVIGQDMLVMRNFTSGRLDFLLYSLRKAGVPKIDLKAVITPQNADWTFYQLYKELMEEHERMHPATAEEETTNSGEARHD